MNNILQNVTKVKEEVKIIAVGAAVIAPIVGLVYIISLLIDNGVLNRDLVSNFLLAMSILFMCWGVGGMVQSIKRWRELERAEHERKTQQAFERLGADSHEISF